MSWCCGLGIFFAVLLAVNVLPRLSAALCFVLYLSIASVGQPFTCFNGTHCCWKRDFWRSSPVSRGWLGFTAF